MTILESCDHLESLVSELSLEALSNRWQQGYVKDKTDEEHVADFAESLRKTREFHGTEGPQRLWGVYVGDSNVLLCITGTSPTSEARARFISHTDPKVILQLIDYIRTKEQECSK